MNIHIVANLIISITSAFFSIVQGSTWSSVDTIPGYHPDTWPPILIADPNGAVHAFSSQWVEEEGVASKVIMYNQWKLDHGWTLPVDILLSPVYEARILDAFLDSKGIIHIIFWGGNNIAADIYYSQAPLIHAGKASAWVTPSVVAENASDPESAKFVVHEDESISILYHGKKIGEGVYFTEPISIGRDVPKSFPIFLTGSYELLPFAIQIYKDDLGQYHAIWNMIDFSGQGRGIYYSRMATVDVGWSEPVLLAQAQEGYGVLTPTIIGHEGVLFALYNSGGIVMRQSFDSGITWEAPKYLFLRHVGVNGALSPVIDSESGLHLFFAQRITSSPDIHGMWHSVWLNNQWTEPEALVKNPQVADRQGSKAFDPFEARAVVNQENIILVTWRTDPGLRGNGVWYSTRVLNTPEYSMIPSSESQSPEGSTEPTATPTPVEDENPLLNQALDIPNVASSGFLSDPSIIILFGGGIAVLFIFAIFLNKSINDLRK